MSAIDLYKFVHDNKLEYHWIDIGFGHQEVILHVPFDLLKEFASLIGYNKLSECDILCVLGEHTCSFNMEELCDYFDIDLSEVFGEKEE